MPPGCARRILNHPGAGISMAGTVRGAKLLDQCQLYFGSFLTQQGVEV